jgi:hypothetical protein
MTTHTIKTLEERVRDLEINLMALTESRADVDHVRLREFQMRLMVEDGPLARIKGLANHVEAAHFGKCDCKDPDDCVRRATAAIVRICDGEL